MTEEMFGRYRLDELIGQGGMGEVYRAHDLERKRVVALKRLPAHLAGDREFQTRFRREAEVAARLTEPHIVPIHDYGEIDGRLFIDMRLVTGTDLGRLIERDGPAPADRAVDIITQLAGALAAAHAEHLIHRDLKPSNVLLTDTAFVYLIDFGIAHSPAATAMTATGLTIGTLAYMAPERFLGRPIDHRVDIYALGCLLYQSLTGQAPFPGEGPELMYGHLNTPPPAPSRLRPELPPSLDRVVARALAKDPDERYPTATALAESAQQAITDPHRPHVRAAPAPTMVAPATATAVPSANHRSATPSVEAALTYVPATGAPDRGHARPPAFEQRPKKPKALIASAVIQGLLAALALRMLLIGVGGSFTVVFGIALLAAAACIFLTLKGKAAARGALATIHVLWIPVTIAIGYRNRLGGLEVEWVPTITWVLYVVITVAPMYLPPVNRYFSAMGNASPVAWG
jgi:serine/threonine-protein kinase